jgi:AraC family transcriptional regulator
MNPRIVFLTEKKLIGKRLEMSFDDNRTFELWKSFMPFLKSIKNKIGNKLYSIQQYTPFFFDDFNPKVRFEKWAAVEVDNFENLPEEMEPYTLQEGLYAVFLYQGNPNEAANTFQYIHGTWLPNSEYKLDFRPHFEILGEKYKNNDSSSEEEIWIPIGLKG